MTRIPEGGEGWWEGGMGMRVIEERAKSTEES